MPLLRSARAYALLGALLAALALLVSPGAPPADAKKPGAGVRIYLLRGGDAASDGAVGATLAAAGFSVTSGVETADFTGSGVSLGAYDLVVLLYSQNSARPLPDAGAAALAAYIRNGGGLLSAEWLALEAQRPTLAALASLLPATNRGLNTATGTFFTQLSPNPVINAGLPVTFPVSLANFSGSEGVLEPKPEAAVHYLSSTGRAAGLVSWNPPDSTGRVAMFSTLLSATELASPAMRRLLQNTATWVAGAKDLTPPTLKRFELSGAGTLTSNRNLTLSLQASDRGGARLSAIYVVEYVFSGLLTGPPWQVAQRSGWQPLGSGANHMFGWRLIDTPGVHYLQLFVADSAGNVSARPGLQFISYQPTSAVNIDTNKIRLYRLRPGAGATVGVRMDVESGNPDLYVFAAGNDGVAFHPELDSAVEQFGFTAGDDEYQIEVVGHVGGRYRLSVTAASSTTSDSGPSLDGRGRSSIITLSAYSPRPEDAGLGAPPATTGPASVGRVIYLPLLRR